MSPLFQYILSFCRLIVVLYPMKPRYKHSNFIYRQVGGVFVLSLFASIVCSAYIWISGIVLPSKMCSPFFDPSKTITLIKYTNHGITTLHILMSGATVFNYICLQVALERSQINIKKSSNPSEASSSTLKRSVTFALSALVSWIPSSIVHFTCFYINTYPVKLILWTTLC